MSARILFGITLLAIGTACGPMNQPVGREAGNELASLRSGQTVLTRNKRFVLYLGLSDAKARPVQWDNAYTIRVMRADQFTPLSPAATVTIHSDMPGMAGMDATDLATVNPDGSFSATLIYSMPGLWSVKVTIQDGTETDEYEFEEQI
ncbi:MAG: FixH family protein [Oligoflexia bacterium]|nr:FixH family protein [Oligoflexia bacterium]